MDKEIRVSVNMQATVTELLDDYSDVVATDADLTASEALRQKTMGELRVAARVTEEKTSPTTKAKEEAKRLTIDEFVKPLGRVCAYGARTGNTLLAGQTDINAWDLHHEADGTIMAHLEFLMGVMRGAVVGLPSVTGAQLDAIDDMMDKLAPMLPSATLKIVDRTTARETVETKTREARLILETQHDKILLSYNHQKPTTPAQVREKELFSKWAHARELRDAPTHHKKPAGGTPPVV